MWKSGFTQDEGMGERRSFKVTPLGGEWSGNGLEGRLSRPSTLLPGGARPTGNPHSVPAPVMVMRHMVSTLRPPTLAAASGDSRHSPRASLRPSLFLPEEAQESTGTGLPCACLSPA